MPPITRNPHGYHDAQGLLKILNWSERKSFTRVFQGSAIQDEFLEVDPGPRPVQMAGSSATGQPLVTNGELGVDLIRLAAGRSFAPHTHPGDHLLIVVRGEGTITYDGKIYPTEAGQVYMVEGAVPHAVGAITDHAILAVGSPHRAVDALDRMELVEYHEVLSAIGRLHCLVCDLVASSPAELRSLGCAHCDWSEA